MSDPIVLLTKIDELHPHPNADKLELVYANGSQYVVGKGDFQEGDSCLLIGPDCILPKRIQDDLGLESPRVRVVKLRGEVSNGLCLSHSLYVEWAHIQPCDEIRDITDTAGILGITKYEPPVRVDSCCNGFGGDTTFQKYTDIQNITNWPDIFEPGEKVWVSEKIDGQNFRIGVFIEDGKVFFKAGSHRQDRQLGTPHWKCFPTVAPFLTRCAADAVQRGTGRYSLILYGELYGSLHGGYKAMNYGYPYEVRYTFYDICENGIYWDKDRVNEEFELQDFPTPYGNWIEFDREAINTIVRLGSETATVSGLVKEGVVITPKCERSDPRLGRVILKAINPAYLILKGDKDVRDQ